MKISYFPNQAALNSPPIMTAFLDSCRAQGWQVVENSFDADAVVIWSVLWAGRMRSNQQVYDHYRKLNKPVFILEVGNLVRGTTWRVSVNNVNGDGIFGEENDLNRPYLLNVQLHTRPNLLNVHPILIACQRGDSLQWQGQPDIVDWVTSTINQLRQYTDREIIVRPHPRFPIGSITGATIENPRAVIGSYDGWDLDYQQYHCVVNYNSGPSVQAVINDVPVICDTSSLAADMSITYSEIENPPSKDRVNWFNDLCQKEYLIEEIANGVPLIKLQKVLFS
jgi:hypothetical protein